MFLKDWRVVTAIWFSSWQRYPGQTEYLNDLRFD